MALSNNNNFAHISGSRLSGNELGKIKGIGTINGITLDNSKKYNTIDISQTQNLQTLRGIANVSQKNNLANQMISDIGILGKSNQIPGQTTAETSNPSNDNNSNSEFIDIMRKIPRILCERYELMDVLGKGAHGRIYLAVDLVTKDKVAIKLMEKSTKNKSKFQREISLMKDMMKLAKKKPLKEDCVTYEDVEVVQLNNKLQQQQQAMSNSTVSLVKNRRSGFPRLYSYCSDQNYYYLVMQLLGVNLKELKESISESKFEIQTLIIVALQLLNRLNSIHSYGYIHRDLKPANVVIGNDNTEAHFIYLIDFGLAKKENSSNPIEVTKGSYGTKSGGGLGQTDEEIVNIIDPKTGKKKTALQTLKEYMDDEKDNLRVVGTAMYAGLAAHLPNKKYLKKDDLESLLFLLSYFGLGQLPWRYKTNQEGLEKMMKYKLEIQGNELFPEEVFPPQFIRLFDYIRALPDDTEPDYNFMEQELFQAALQKKIDPTFLIALDWMNCRPLITQNPSFQKFQLQATYQNKIKNQLFSNQNNKQSQSQPQNNRIQQSILYNQNIPQITGYRQINNSSQQSAITEFKTPLLSDKLNKKSDFTMTPEIQTKTNAEQKAQNQERKQFNESQTRVDHPNTSYFSQYQDHMQISNHTNFNINFPHDQNTSEKISIQEEMKKANQTGFDKSRVYSTVNSNYRNKNNASPFTNMNNSSMELQSQLGIMQGSPTLSPTGENQIKQQQTAQLVYGSGIIQNNATTPGAMMKTIGFSNFQKNNINKTMVQKPKQQNLQFTNRLGPISNGQIKRGSAVLNATNVQKYQLNKNILMMPQSSLNQTQMQTGYVNFQQISPQKIQTKLQNLNHSSGSNGLYSQLQQNVSNHNSFQVQSSTTRQIKNRSALGIIGGNIISNNQQQNIPSNSSIEGARTVGQTVPSSQATSLNPFTYSQNRNNMYNTMYGTQQNIQHQTPASSPDNLERKSSNQINKLSAASNRIKPALSPVHIRIEDQNGVGDPGQSLSKTVQEAKRQLLATTNKFNQTKTMLTTQNLGHKKPLMQRSKSGLGNSQQPANFQTYKHY